MKKNIEALWMGRPIPPTISQEENQLFSEKMAQMRNLYSRLEIQMTPETKRLFDEYTKIQSDLNSIENKNSFVYGFSLGVRLIAEGLEE